ncbi:lamin tail domain-containing protein [Streptomyces sp. NPDC001156]
MSASSVTARRLAAVAVASAAAVGAFVPSASAADHDLRGRNARVEISDVQSDTWGRQDRSNRSLNREWVEITNNTRRDVNLSGWTLSDRDGHTYTFHHYRLDGRSTVRVHTGYGRDTRTDLYQDRRRSVFEGRHDTATLRNAYGRVVDTFFLGGDRDRDGGYRNHGGYHRGH